MPLIDPVTMTSASGKGTSAQSTAKMKDAASPLQPISLQQSAFAQAVTHLVPVLQLGFFLVCFNALVTDPVSVMWRSLPVVTGIQIIYAFVCLPVAGSQSAKAARKPRPGEKKKPGVDSLGPNVFVAALLSLLLTVFAIPVLYTAIILFGAPLLTHVPHTFFCAAHLAVLTLFPLFYVHGIDGAAWAAVASGRAPFDDTFGGLVGGVVGAWLGAVPIPLDWDREWQKWPVTILCGLYGGYVLGKLVGGTVGFGRRF